MVRGDPGYGKEGNQPPLEERRQPYLLRLRRQTKNAQRLVALKFPGTDWSRPDNHGCQMVEAQLHCKAGAPSAGRSSCACVSAAASLVNDVSTASNRGQPSPGKAGGMVYRVGLSRQRKPACRAAADPCMGATNA